MQEKAREVLQEMAGLATAGAPRVDLNAQPARQIEAAGICLDYSRARIDERVLALGEKLLAVADISGWMNKMLAGKEVNFTERQAAWHSHLRDPATSRQVAEQFATAGSFAENVRSGKIQGAAGPYRDVVHIGIGGSHLGPKLLCEAFAASGPNVHFISNLDPTAASDVLRKLDPGTTLIVAVSKSGNTIETVHNVRQAANWLANSIGATNARRQLIAVSANPQAGQIFSCPTEQVFQLWDWTGGRYSLWSNVSITAMIACGFDLFRRFLDGAHQMDLHARNNGGLTSMPAMLALLRCWHSMALKSQTHCVIAYAHRLRSLASYLQQLAMESNGKSVNRSGKPVAHPACEIWWGGEGSNDQHSYFQLLLQGGQPIPSDFVRPAAGENEETHRQLVAHCLGMSRALTLGRSRVESLAQLQATGLNEQEAERLAPHLVVDGGQPVNLLVAEQLTPETLGALLALYEHQIVIQGWLHGINPFDQFGVAFRHQNFKEVLAAMQHGGGELDASTSALIKRTTRPGKS